MKELLSNTVATSLIKEDRGNSSIVIGAPHHAPGGVKKLPCPEHEDSDENTGFIASGVGELLNACTIIACNAKVDPNKKLSTSYSKQIIKWAPKYLIEIHGHGGKKVKPNVVEISSGSKVRSKFSERFAEILDGKFKQDKVLKEYLVYGDFINIYFKANASVTITDERWVAYHIELPPSLRIDKNNELPDSTAVLVHCLVDTIKEICI